MAGNDSDEALVAQALADRENLRYEEIAKILGLPENTVGTYLFRAKEQMRSKLLESWGDPEKSEG